ncbi:MULTISPECIES: hypothetical protein [unclassified Paenibacillus]|uniref:hypothetical protein n=1 Tax=unclassified Paenibacillus TaxID=185978 RepID=UPI0027841187|nr:MULTISPECIES: hypothetical protein [unclassified Paenibacillus]MDQ0896307.1 hypothetical protein [Paenibacillus sp. V4I7]MDQ0913765.1 hypothetical protein [Paenibacillus sp. V4I5]
MKQDRMIILLDILKEQQVIKQSKEYDIVEAKLLIESINKISGTNYEFKKILDIERIGGETNKQPEALFRDDLLDEDAVVEVKTFAYEDNKQKADVMYKMQELYAWFQEVHRANRSQDLSFVFEIKIKELSFKPSALLKDIKNSENIFDFSNKYVDLKIYKWHRDTYMEVGDSLEFHYEQYQNKILVNILMDHIVVPQKVSEVLNYDHYAEILFSKWQEGKWDKKFILYHKHRKFLLIKILMRSENGIAFITEDFKLLEFCNVFMRKFENIASVQQLDGLFMFLENQLVDVKNNKV